MKELNCYKCKAPLDVEAISFRTLCPRCIAPQHCCLTCKFHAPGRRNSCLIPESDPIREPEGQNFCDFYKRGEKESASTPRSEALERAKRLLGD